MSIERATYYANYEDYNGFDEVPCLVDMDTLAVTQFFPAISCRWNDNVMCVSETIQIESSQEAFDAIKYDEWNDAVDGGFNDDYDRDRIILFDNDMLEVACADFIS